MDRHVLGEKSLFVVCILAVMCFAVPVHAGGLYLNEVGTPVMGNAGAGAQAEASDASIAFHNPAGMTLLDDRQLMLTGGLLYSKVRFESDGAVPTTGGDGGNAGGLAPMLGSFYVHPINEDLRFGVSFISISGAVLDYNSGWTGRYQNERVKLITISVTPTLAYRVNNWLSVGGGPVITYGMLEMDAAVNRGGLPDGQATIDGDDIDVGYTLSAMFELSKQTRIGIVYLSETEFDLEGDLELRPSGFSVGTDSTLRLAQVIRGSIYHDLNDQWALVGSLGWEDWSTMDEVTIKTDRASSSIPRNWDDTWHYAAGIHYHPTPKWLLRTGIAYDTNPVDAIDRTADMPIDRQVHYAVGASYDWSESLMVGASFTYADYGSGKINGSTLSGEYDRNGLYFLGLHANWKF